MTPPHPVVATGAFGATVALLLPPLLPAGGLAPITLAAGVAVAVGAPVAGVLWRQPRPEARHADALDVALEGVAEVAGLLLVAAAAAQVASLAPSNGPLWALVAIVAAALGTWRRGRLVLLGAVAAAVGALALAAPTQGDVTTLLEPRWTGGPWVGRSAWLGLLAAGIGSGAWTLGPDRRPGDRRAPFVSAGVAVLVAVGLAVWQAGRFGSTLGVGAPGHVASAAGASVAVAAGAAAWLHWGAGRRGPRMRWLRWVGALGATAWITGPGASGSEFLVFTVLPLLVAAQLAGRARRAVATDRWVLGLTGAATGLAVFVAHAPLPPSMLDAVGVAAVAVLAFWVVATRTVRAVAA